jgi:hypothetical protein
MYLLRYWDTILVFAAFVGVVIYVVRGVKLRKAKDNTVRADQEVFAISSKPVLRIEYDYLGEQNSKLICDMKVLLDELLAGTRVVSAATGPGEKESEENQDGEFIEDEDTDFVDPGDDIPDGPDVAEENFVPAQHIKSSVI